MLLPWVIPVCCTGCIRVRVELGSLPGREHLFSDPNNSKISGTCRDGKPTYRKGGMFFFDIYGSKVSQNKVFRSLPLDMLGIASDCS